MRLVLILFNVGFHSGSRADQMGLVEPDFFSELLPNTSYDSDYTACLNRASRYTRAVRR